MKREFKKYSFVILSFLLVSSLVSCDGASSSDSTSSSSSGNDVEIVFWHTFGQGIIDKVQQKCTEFSKLIKENEGVNVNVQCTYQGGYTDLLSKINKGYSVGNTPTISVAYPDHVAEYLNLGDDFVVNLDKYIDDPDLTFGSDSYLDDSIAGTSDFIPAFFQEGSNYIKEGTYSMPFLKSTELMFYNKNVVENLLAPKYKEPSQTVSQFMNTLTWTTFMQMCQDVRNDIDDNNGGTYGTALQVPAAYDSDSNLFITQLYQRNIPYLEYQDGKGVLSFDNQQARDMVSEFKESFGNINGTEALFWTSGSNGNKYGSDSFKQGQVLFSIGSSGGSGYQDPGVSFKADVCPVPAYDLDRANYITQGPTLAIFNNNGLSDAKNEIATKYAWKLLKYLTSTDVNVDMCLASQGYVPVRSSSYDSETYLEYLEAAGEDLGPSAAKVVIDSINGRYFNTAVFKGSAYAREQVGGIVTSVLLGKYSVDQAFSNAISQIKLHM